MKWPGGLLEVGSVLLQNSIPGGQVTPWEPGKLCFSLETDAVHVTSP